MNMDEIEAKLNKIKLVREIEHVLAVMDRSSKEGALIYAIRAEDAAESERSVEFTFSDHESQLIFAVAADSLRVRYEALKAEL